MITQAGIIHGHALQTEYSLPTNHIAFEQSVQILLHLDTYWFVINYSGILRPSQHLLHHTIGHSLPESGSCDATCSNTSLPKQGAKRVPCRLRTCILPYVTKNRAVPCCPKDSDDSIMLRTAMKNHLACDKASVVILSRSIANLALVGGTIMSNKLAKSISKVCVSHVLFLYIMNRYDKYE